LPMQHRDDNPMRETGSLGGVYCLGDGAIQIPRGLLMSWLIGNA
jgi:hypothetical protein